MSVRSLNFLAGPKHLSHSVKKGGDRPRPRKYQTLRAPLMTAECSSLLPITGAIQYWEASPSTTRAQGPGSQRHSLASQDECTLYSRVRAKRRIQNPPLTQSLCQRPTFLGRRPKVACVLEVI